jgi:hypothetical protein
MFHSASLPHNWKGDERDVLFHVTLNNQPYDLYAPSIALWVEMLALSALYILLETLLSIPTYYILVKQARTTHAYLVGWGILVPFFICAPMALTNAVDMEHKLIRFFATVVAPTCCVFRTTEAMYGFAPVYSTTSWIEYCKYYASPMLHVYNHKLERFQVATWRNVAEHVCAFSFYLCITGAYISCFYLFPNVFPTLAESRDNAYLFHWHTLFHWQWLKDGALYALLMQLYMTTCSQGMMGLACVFTGRTCHPMMDNPMLQSTSPSDFWGRRWNILVHHCLKNGVYKPVRWMGGSPNHAVIAAFVASGLLHEWILPLAVHDYKCQYGVTLLFFLWQGVLVVVESQVCQWDMFQTLSKQLPRPLRTLCIVLLGLPPAHWICHCLYE